MSVYIFHLTNKTTYLMSYGNDAGAIEDAEEHEAGVLGVTDGSGREVWRRADAVRCLAKISPEVINVIYRTVDQIEEGELPLNAWAAEQVVSDPSWDSPDEPLNQKAKSDPGVMPPPKEDLTLEPVLSDVDGDGMKAWLIEREAQIEDPADVRTVRMLTAPWSKAKVRWLQALMERDLKRFDANAPVVGGA